MDWNSRGLGCLRSNTGIEEMVANYFLMLGGRWVPTKSSLSRQPLECVSDEINATFYRWPVT
jgi:hypothetical protein